MAGIFEGVIYSAVLVWIFCASVFDIRTREVPNWINFSLIGVGLGLRGIYSVISMDYWFIVSGIIGLAVCFAAALVMSYTGQWGDGDSKMLMGIGACLGFGFGFSFLDLAGWPVLLSFFVNSLIVGAVYGIIFGIAIAVRNFSAFRKEISRMDRKILALPLLPLVLFSAVSLFFSGYMRLMIFLLGIVIFIGSCLFLFSRCVERSCLYVQKDASSLVPGDLVVGEVKFKGKVICSSRDRCLDEKQIMLLRRHKIKKVLIKEGMPFVPSFFLGFIVTLIWGNLIAAVV